MSKPVKVNYSATSSREFPPNFLKYNSIFLKGKEEEKERRTIEIISNGFKNNLSLEIIASMAGISIEEVKQYIKDNHLDEK